tara:strand:+ start:483 stop:740 length:258 start_codon:yes stop_codon:yes gene_type:complete
MKLNIKYNRTDITWAVKKINNTGFQLSFANQEDAENVALQYNQDLADEGYDKAYYVDEVNLLGADAAEQLINDKQHREHMLSIYQ